MKPKRPTSVTWLVLGVLTLCIVYFTRLVTTLQQWDFLTTLPLSASPVYLFITGLTWSILPLPVMWGLWVGKKWAPKVMIGLTIFYGLYYWLEQWLLKNNPLRITNWPFSLVVTLIILILACWIPFRKATKKFFGEKNEQKPEN